MPRRRVRIFRRDTRVPPYRENGFPQKQRGAPCGAPRVFRPCVAQTEEGYIRRFYKREPRVQLVDVRKICCFCNGRSLLHALCRIRAVELVAGRSDLPIDIKRCTIITDIRCLDVIVADRVGHIGVGRRIMEPERVTGIYIHRIPCHHKGLTVCQLDRSTVRLANGADNSVIGYNKISGGALKVDAAGIVVEHVVVQCDRTALALSHERILRSGRRIKCAVLDGHVHIKVLVAVQIAIERAAVKLIGGRIQCALVGSRGHVLDAVEGDILALERSVGTVLNVPPVVRQSKRTVDCGKVESCAAVAADDVDLRGDLRQNGWPRGQRRTYGCRSPSDCRRSSM